MDRRARAVHPGASPPDGGVPELADYLGELADADPEPGAAARLVTDDGPDGRLARDELVSTALLLLVAGHETTVNLIANASLVLLRHPRWLDRLRTTRSSRCRWSRRCVRWDPPVHFLPWRTALDDITIGGTTIPRGAPVTLVLAAGNRDPGHVSDPDRSRPGPPPRCSTSASAAASTTASARPWPGWRRRWRCGPWPGSSPGPASWRTRPNTARARSCAARATCASP